MEAVGKGHFNCGAFDIKGLLTENYVYPLQWKMCMIFISFAFIMMTITVFLTMVSCCRQAISGKSIHNIAGALQLIASKRMISWPALDKKNSFNNISFIRRHISIDKYNFPCHGLGRGSGSTTVWTRCRSILARRLQNRYVVIGSYYYLLC